MDRIGIIGAGVVGQATGKGLARYGRSIVFCDVNSATIADLKKQGYSAVKATEFIENETDATMICVGTPTDAGEIDLRYVRSACQFTARVLKRTDRYHLVVVRSTILPCTTENVVIPLLEEGSGKLAGRDFGVCYNPEFLREASALDDFVAPWVMLVGANHRESELAARRLYEPITSRLEMPLTVTDFRSAEMVKYAHNLYNAAKISYTNEIWSACRQLGIDGDLVMSVVSRSAEAMWNPQYGTRGGFPYGGNCLPKDTEAFLAFAREHGLDMRLLDAVVQVNERMVMSEAPGRRLQWVASGKLRGK